jgi:hypothetical protein
MRRRPFAVSFCFAALGLSAASTARADADAPERAAAPFVFQGRAVYAGGGGGVLPELDRATENWSILATFPVAQWASVEATGFGFHFLAPTATAGNERSSVALGIGVGLRFAPPPRWAVRPYAAARFEHIHMVPDPYDPKSGDAGMAMDMTSMHRWALAGALGVEAALSPRFRAALEAGPTVFTGSVTHGGGQALAMLGVAF